MFIICAIALVLVLGVVLLAVAAAITLKGILSQEEELDYKPLKFDNVKKHL